MPANILVKKFERKTCFLQVSNISSVQIKLTFVDLYLNEIHNGIGTQSLPLQANFSARIHNLKLIRKFLMKQFVIKE
jgi:hypothetical protein